jgi:hypothetical protein
MGKKEKDYLDTKDGQDFLEEQNKKAAKIEMVSKLADRQKRGKKLTEVRKGKKATDIDAALNTFEAQKHADKNYKDLDLDFISDEKLSDREDSYKKGGLVRSGKPKLAKKGWR